jgi:hypothetical protein
VVETVEVEVLPFRRDAWDGEKLGWSEERFLSTQADRFTGVKGEEKVGLLRSEWRSVV